VNERERERERHVTDMDQSPCPARLTSILIHSKDWNTACALKKSLSTTEIQLRKCHMILETHTFTL